MKRRPLIQRLLALLSGLRLHLPEIEAHFAEYTPGTIKNVLYALHSDGLVVHTGHGTYSLWEAAAAQQMR